VVSQVVARLEERLPWPVYVLQSGLVLNALGNGAANPFVLLYLHDARGIPLAAAGLASGVGAGCALISSLASGSLADRAGARVTTVAGLACSATAFALYPLVREPWHAVALAALSGTGAGAWLTGQSALLAAIVPPERRHLAFAQQRVAANLGLGLGGMCGGLLVSVDRPSTFTTLFLANAATFVAYGAFVARLSLPSNTVLQGRSRPPGYRVLVRDRALLGLLAVDLALVAGAVSLLNGLVPIYARDQAGATERAIGFLFLLNTLLIVAVQLPVARAVEGRRRMRMLALAGAAFAACWLAVLASAWVGLLALVGAFALMSAGECLYDAVRGPLVADLAPPGLGGRYMAAAGFSWQLGFVVGPVVGAALLGAEPHALWPLAAVVCLGAAGAALALESRLPQRARVTAVISGSSTASAVKNTPPSAET
jgi:MFS family permease